MNFVVNLTFFLVFDSLHFLSINMALFIFIYLLNFFEILLYKYLTSLLLYALRACRGTIWLNSRPMVAIMFLKL